MITISQLKAARALLDWKQADLSEASGISLAAIANLEQGKGSPRPSTMEAISAALEQAGIEFTPDPGVRLRREKFQMRVLEGHESVFELWDDIQLALGKTGGEVLISGVDENVFLKKYKAELGPALKRQREAGIFNRLLIADDDNTILIGPDAYRGIPRALFQQTPYYVYADRFAIINWGPPQTIMLLQNKAVADTFKRQFEFNWQLGKKLKNDNKVIAALPGFTE